MGWSYSTFEAHFLRVSEQARSTYTDQWNSRRKAFRSRRQVRIGWETGKWRKRNYRVFIACQGKLCSMIFLSHANICTFYVNLIGVLMSPCKKVWLEPKPAWPLAFGLRFWLSSLFSGSLVIQLASQALLAISPNYFLSSFSLLPWLCNRWEVSAETLPLVPSLLITFPLVLLAKEMKHKQDEETKLTDVWQETTGTYS